MLIDDGRGTGFKARVNANNRIVTSAVTETEELHTIVAGDGYNINSGTITYTAAGTMLYLSNNEDKDIVVAAIAVGVGSGTTSDIGEVTVTANITGGDLISDATAVSINANRNFGSSRTLVADVYAGKSGGTATGGSDVLLFYQGTSGRLFASLNLVLQKGDNIAITYDPKLSSGSVKAYCALPVYLQNSESKD